MFTSAKKKIKKSQEMIDVRQPVRNLKTVVELYNKININNKLIIEKIGSLYFCKNTI